MTTIPSEAAHPAAGSRFIDEIPAIVADQFSTLTTDEQSHFFAEYERRRKPGFWGWFTWAIGWHFGYIEGRWGLNVLYFLAFGPSLGMWWLYEGIFRVRGRLQNQRHEAAIAAMRDLRAVSAI